MLTLKKIFLKFNKFIIDILIFLSKNFCFFLKKKYQYTFSLLLSSAINLVVGFYSRKIAIPYIKDEEYYKYFYYIIIEVTFIVTMFSTFLIERIYKWKEYFLKRISQRSGPVSQILQEKKKEYEDDVKNSEMQDIVNAISGDD